MKRKRCQHSRLNRHAGSGLFGPPRLRQGAYKPRELANRAITSAYREPWTSSQEWAVDCFVGLYLNHRYDTNPPNTRLIWKFLTHLDYFFFEGLLTQRKSFELGLSVGPPNSGDKALGRFWGPGKLRLDPYIEIYTHVEKEGRFEQRTLEDVLETLVHEAAHGYLGIFSCQEQECLRDSHNTIGTTGHGQVWVSLAAAMYKSIQYWHPELRGVFNKPRYARTVWQESYHDTRKYYSMWTMYPFSLWNPFRTGPRGRQLVHIKNEKLKFRDDFQELVDKFEWNSEKGIGRRRAGMAPGSRWSGVYLQVGHGERF